MEMAARAAEDRTNQWKEGTEEKGLRQGAVVLAIVQIFT